MNNKNVVTKSGSVTYYVNRDKKTVVAVIKCKIGTPVGIFDKVVKKLQKANGNKNVLDVRGDYFKSQNVYINERYVGVAKCHEHDVFDEEFGKKLALARAEAKKADAVHTNFFKFVEQLDELNYLAGKKSDELYRRWIDSQNEIADLLWSISKGKSE